ncbi:CorA Metal Ion Transporter (MIT) Family (nucleomorph) [Chroomonas mesostigmatica CCMP1168]|uniref:Magnesium transporter n=1 Tax=Chroomonas mesostigmatica CCMP1168 TaxID=1195612 RepID=J7G7N0_9CRYP|nr:CorA Metal Ion Transporter (MIT) Family [Chroomonas mesostigmatica CCMP1168]|mmetsp:Transcript_16783/g.41020  ORF Transcript_16783/g.41020 Transcript_16783/m.41020 type:complete len:391 (+) Transcript_16783:2070-3242(+)
MSKQILKFSKSIQTSSFLRRTELVCLEFDIKGTYIIKRLSRSDLLNEARISIEEDLNKLHKIYTNFASEKKLDKPLSKKVNQKDRRELLQFFRGILQSRDIRQVNPSFSAKPALWVRHNAILVSLEQIRAVILYNKLFLFDPDNPKVQRAGKIISERLGKTEERNVDMTRMPFEFRALEGILVNVCMSLEKNFASLEPTILENLDDLPTRLTSRQLEELRTFKQRLSQFSAKAQDVQRVLQEVLEEDETMINMYLTEKKFFPKRVRNPIEHDEIEILSESYLQVVDHLTNRAELLDNAIDDTEDLVTIRLDTIRNRILFVELTLNIISLTFAAGSLVVGMFGMNLGLPIFKEEFSSKNYFFLCSSLIMGSIVSLYIWFFFWSKEKRLYST